MSQDLIKIKTLNDAYLNLLTRGKARMGNDLYDINRIDPLDTSTMVMVPVESGQTIVNLETVCKTISVYNTECKRNPDSRTRLTLKRISLRTLFTTPTSYINVVEGSVTLSETITKFINVTNKGFTIPSTYATLYTSMYNILQVLLAKTKT